MIQPHENAIKRMARELAGQHGWDDWEQVPNKDDFIVDAHKLWEAAFETVQPNSIWWAGQIAQVESVDLVYIMPKGAGACWLIRDAGGDEVDLPSFSINRTYGKDGRVGHFQVSKIGKTS